jgi:hypothetical protein
MAFELLDYFRPGELVSAIPQSELPLVLDGILQPRPHQVAGAGAY